MAFGAPQAAMASGMVPPPSPAPMMAKFSAGGRPPAAAPHKPSDPRILNQLLGKAKEAFGGKVDDGTADEDLLEANEPVRAITRPAEPEQEKKAAPKAVSPADRIKELARTQNVSGSWGSGSDEIETTAAALLAFVRAGHTTRAGNYRRQLQKAVDFLGGTSAVSDGFDDVVRTDDHVAAGEHSAPAGFE